MNADRYIYSYFLRFDKDYILSLDTIKKFVVIDTFPLILHILNIIYCYLKLNFIYLHIFVFRRF